MSTRDITAALEEMYGVEVSAQTITTITNKVMPLVEEWQARPLDALDPIVYLDALYFNLNKEHTVENRSVYIVLGVTLEEHKDVLGHWVGDGVEGTSFWLNVLTDLKTAACKICSSLAWMA